MAKTKQRIGYQDGGNVLDPGSVGPPVMDPGNVGPPVMPNRIADPGASQPKYVGISAPIPASHQPRGMRRGRHRLFAQGGPVEDPSDDDTVYPTTAPKWDQLSPEAAMMGASVGYANGGAVQPGADMNRRAALLAGLRKRYDAMIAMAQGALAHRDENTAVRFAQRAHDMVPDGKSLILHVQPDGNVLAIVHDPRGGEQSRHIMTPDQFHHYLIGPATSFDHVIDNGVGHNLHIASGQKQPRVPEHPADPIHKVRQVLQHTRKMFGVDKIGQAPPRVGYAAGGPVRGYANGGQVDGDDDWQQYTAEPVDQVIDQPPDDNQGVNLHQRPPEPITADSSMARLLSGVASKVGSKAIDKLRSENAAIEEQQARQAAVIPNAWGSIKKSLADYINGANAAPPQEVDGALQGIAEQNPGLTVPETVQRAIAEQNPSLNASGSASGDDSTVGTGYGGAQTNQPSSNDNREEFFRRLRAGEPTGIDLDQYLQHGYDFNNPLSPQQVPTTQSMADRDKAVSQYVIQAPGSPVPGSRVPGSPVQSSNWPPETGLLSVTNTSNSNNTKTGNPTTRRRGISTSASTSTPTPTDPLGTTETPLGMRQREAASGPSLHDLLNPPAAPAAGALPPPPKMTGNKAVDAQNIQIWKEQAIAARGVGSQQNAASIAQQRFAAAATAAVLNTFNVGERDLIKSVYTKANSQGEESLTPDEKALRNEYVQRIRQYRQSQSGRQAQAGGQQPIQVRSMADAAKLPRGTQFLDPQGNLRAVP